MPLPTGPGWLPWAEAITGATIGNFASVGMMTGLIYNRGTAGSYLTGHRLSRTGLRDR